VFGRKGDRTRLVLAIWLVDFAALERVDVVGERERTIASLPPPCLQQWRIVPEQVGSKYSSGVCNIHENG
jgi:hypothetical protein